MARKRSKISFAQSSEAIRRITAACALLAEVKQVVYDSVRPGVSLKALDTIAFNEIVKRSAKPNFLGYQAYPASICASLNEELIHTIPNDRILVEGDLLSIDMGLVYQGYHSDSAFTISVGEKANPENEMLIKAAKESFEAGLSAIKKGATIGDIGKAIGAVIDSYGLYTPHEFSGHGLGTQMHMRPNVMNYDDKQNIDYHHPIENNMVICIEPMILQGSRAIKIAPNGWDVIAASGKKASHYEHTVLIKDYQPIVLTKGI